MDLVHHLLRITLHQQVVVVVLAADLVDRLLNHRTATVSLHLNTEDDELKVES
jgi:hypothetical protein